MIVNGCYESATINPGAAISVSPEATDLLRNRRVTAILDSARKCRARGRHRWAAYEDFKIALSRVVGWHSRNPRLASAGHYEAAIRMLARAMGV